MTTKEQLFDRQRHVANAVASQRLEGLKVDPTTLADLQRYSDGLLDIENVLARLKDRIASGKV
ncbi:MULTISPECIES: antitoxin VbhA family protein [Thalassospira]|jgi:hypothetical protein|uniref:Antitoxin VbhA domain-containing protein n=1 Tax=Thalassospira xiamenensis TaxID=220697 RepID=A0ABR5XZ33_9PROT|nr:MULTISPECIES: antitoxin VbhA family protein [Thalassospira]KZD00996.1 hypothetical protein AUP40_21290 [Thalassospira xiamenensis]KZD08305.1 hypothetical protein AUP45_16680 [Thalassospira xiamenensis]MAB33002.1 DUF2559 domain-containing protein [Thalassospira sp.]MAL29789.1 DUF2559 domain-containing protein [Thalassospira sp.]MBA06904.1 DUF2559 domain-containing protein [Thalassospira sp.]|tara:strand:+ start:555 stop:743 length:189 start_codon:yes stop_codon:yes gene_type:complete